jgi:hypothetical protein
MRHLLEYLADDCKYWRPHHPGIEAAEPISAISAAAGRRMCRGVLGLCVLSKASPMSLLSAAPYDDKMRGICVEAGAQRNLIFACSNIGQFSFETLALQEDAVGSFF